MTDRHATKAMRTEAEVRAALHLYEAPSYAERELHREIARLEARVESRVESPSTSPDFDAEALAYLGPCGTCDGSGVVSILAGTDGLHVGDEECAECTGYREAELKKLSAAFARMFAIGSARSEPA